MASPDPAPGIAPEAPSLAALASQVAAQASSPSSPARMWEDRLMEIAVAALEDPAERERIIAAIESVGGASRAARIVKGLLLLGAGAAVIVRGSALFDGASLVVGTALAGAGAVELAGAL